jgi:CheY-like chemotaxis protein
MTRILHGKLPLDRTVVDVHALLHQTLGICRSDLQGKRSRLELDLAAKEAHVSADSARLQQVFWNLIKNAVKFTGEGGRLAIRTRNGPGPESGPDGRGRSLLTIEVADSGIGIEPELLPRIFDVFEQGEAGVNRRHGGLGLGLAISRSIAEAHGGTLTVASPGKGQGATFTLAMETVRPRPTLPGVPAANPDAATLARRLRILLVEDDQNTRRVMARLLKQRGFEVSTAATLADAIHTSESYPFDLLISDIGLPDGTGHDLIRSLRARRRVKGIALSGFGMDSDIARSRAAGFDAHLTKPVNFNYLETTIRRVASDDSDPGD